MPGAATLHTADRILDIAERLVQSRGFNAFSYGDIAQELGIRNAAIHYHFPSKDMLGTALVVRYAEAFRGLLTGLAHLAPKERLRRYCELYIEVLARGERLCLCGMLAADYLTLPPAMRSEVQRFFTENEQWLAAVLEEGRRSGQLELTGTPRNMARVMLDALEGGMLVSRCHGDVARFRQVVQQLLGLIGA